MALSNYKISQIHVGKAAITDRIYAGFLDSSGKDFNKKKDVTAEFTQALVDKYCGYISTFYLNGRKYKVEVTDITDNEGGRDLE